MVTVSCLLNVLLLEVFLWLWFSRAGWAKDQDILVAGNPGALTEIQNEAAVQPARGREVQVFEGSLHREPGRANVAFDPVLAALAALRVHKQGETVLKGQFSVLRVGLLFP